MEQTQEQLEALAVVGLDEDLDLVEALLPPESMEKARELQAFQRARGISDARALLRSMLIHLAEGCKASRTSRRSRPNSK